MCMSPKIPDPPEPPPPPAAPPPPTKTAERTVNTALKKRSKAVRRGVSALSIRRPTIKMGGSGRSGANIY